jgi:hypothetical protein
VTGWWLLWGLVVAVVAWQTRQALREPLERDRIIADARRHQAAPAHDVGPDQLRLLEDLDAHLDQYFARMSHLFEELGPPISPDPMAHPGCDRLRQAIRDQREGDQ